MTALADKAGEAIANLNQAIGTAAASATGDVNGDGLGDLIVGASKQVRKNNLT